MNKSSKNMEDIFGSFYDPQVKTSAFNLLHMVMNDNLTSSWLRVEASNAIKSFFKIGKIRRCGRKKHKMQKQQIVKIKCGVCGADIIGRSNKYCSDSCRKKVEKVYRNSYIKSKRWEDIKYKEKTCVFCGNKYKTQNHHVQKFCSLSCAAKFKGEEKKKSRPVYTCKKCGKQFWRYKRINDSYIFCSRKCAGINKSRVKQKIHGGSSRKRAKFYGVDYELVDYMKIFERDMWTCQICGKKTPQKNRGTKFSNAPEIDHRIPISKGGGHTYENVQCACRKCNNKKSNKSNIGQLPLFSFKGGKCNA